MPEASRNPVDVVNGTELKDTHHANRSDRRTLKATWRSDIDRVKLTPATPFHGTITITPAGLLARLADGTFYLPDGGSDFQDALRELSNYHEP